MNRAAATGARALLIAATVAAATASAPTAHAEDRSAEADDGAAERVAPDRRAPAPSPRATDEQLRDEGWLFESEGSTPGSATAAFAALTIGSAWHGVGHRIGGDTETSGRLLAGQGIGIALFGAGLATRVAGHTEPAAREIGTAVAVSGVGLLLAGWSADVIGSLKGSAAPLPPSSRETLGLTAEVYFTTLIERGLDLTSIGVVRIPWVSERWVVRPELQGALDLGYRRVGAGVGHRLRLGRREASYLEFGGAGYDETYANAGTGRNQVSATFELGFDVGDVAEHLGGLEWITRVEVALEHHRFDTGDDGRFSASGRQVHVPVETGVGFNANNGVHLSAGYVSRRDALVGDAGRNVGSFWGRLGIVPTNRLGVDLRLEQGAFTRAWFGLQWLIATRSDRAGEPS